MISGAPRCHETAAIGSRACLRLFWQRQTGRRSVLVSVSCSSSALKFRSLAQLSDLLVTGPGIRIDPTLVVHHACRHGRRSAHIVCRTIPVSPDSSGCSSVSSPIILDNAPGHGHTFPVPVGLFCRDRITSVCRSHSCGIRLLHYGSKSVCSTAYCLASAGTGEPQSVTRVFRIVRIRPYNPHLRLHSVTQIKMSLLHDRQALFQ